VRQYLAVVGRGFEEDEVVASRSLEAAVRGDERRALSVELDERSAVVALSETVPDVGERRQLVPARADIARPRHAVTLALRATVLVHCLQST